jgi:hypothetical protein
MTTTGVELEPCVRGDPFVYSTPLLDGWLASHFTGGMRFTLRVREAISSEVTDEGAVASVTTTSGHITAVGATVTVTIPSSTTTAWPAKKLYFDLQGTISGSPSQSKTVAMGTVEVLADASRTP